MGRESNQLLQAFSHEQCPSYLCERICQALVRERERTARTRLVFSSLSGISSLAGLMFALPALLSAASTTGFTSFASLMVSDSDLVTSHFSTFGMSLLEALPGFEVTITLLLVAILLVSLRTVVQSFISAHVLAPRQLSFVTSY
jgi:hypothetical protein